jgi:hypothetical protein
MNASQLLGQGTAAAKQRRRTDRNVTFTRRAPREEPRPLSRQARTALVTRVRCVEAQVFDGEGRLRRGVSRQEAASAVKRLNEMRCALGWLEIDLDGHWRWPG